MKTGCMPVHDADEAEGQEKRPVFMSFLLGRLADSLLWDSLCRLFFLRAEVSPAAAEAGSFACRTICLFHAQPAD